MRITVTGRAAAALALLGALFAIPAHADDGSYLGRVSGDRDVAFRWNQLTQQTIPTPVAGALAGRWYAIVHVAQFEAVNSIERRYTPFRTNVPASRGASARAAAAQAAHDVLVALIPASKPLYDAALADDLVGIPPGLLAQGIDVGRAAAAATLAWALNDGYSAPPPAYAPAPVPGNWQALTPSGASFRQAPGMTPMTLTSTTQFLPKRYPEINSAEYAASFNEVKAVGSAGSGVRSAEQTKLARLWATTITSTTQFAQWNNVARTVADARGYPLLETTRLLALMNASVSDGLLTTMTGKFAYSLWRPITAIRNANDDLNDATVADPTWTTLVGTPPYPSYPGNVACLGAAAATALAKVVGTDAVSFKIRWVSNNSDPDTVQSYSSFWQMALDAADARIYGGLHFRFDNTASQEICPKIATWAYEHVMRPLD